MFEIASPWILTLLALPLLCYVLPPTSFRLHRALKVPFFHAILKIENMQNKFVFYAHQWLFLSIWCLVVIALAGPRWVGKPEPAEREGHNIILALDLSESMALSDMFVNGQPAHRLTVVKQAAETFIKQRINDRLGLILFGTHAYLQTPLTYDHHSLLLRLSDATVGLAGQTTSIGDAIGLAVKRLQMVPEPGRIIILLTDGANTSGVISPIKAAELAKFEHIKIYTIGLGADEKYSVINMHAYTSLDEDTLQEIAKITHGQYFRATDPRSLKRIYHTINQLEIIQQEQANIRPQRDYYQWPLSIACILFFCWLMKISLRNNFFLRFTNDK